MNHALELKASRSTPLPAEFPGLHFMGDEEAQAVLRVLGAKHLYRYYRSETPSEVDLFEQEFAAFLGVPHALGVTSGSAALHTALAALGVGPGQEVIVPAYLWVAVVAAVVNLGAIPILADIDDTFCIDPQSVATKITPRTTGIVAVHMNGVAAELDELVELKRRHGLFLLEDCAQCVGGSYNGKPVGSFGDVAAFSFQINKNMTCGEGGCVATSSRELYLRCVASHDTGYLRGEAGIPESSSGVQAWGRGYRLDEIRGAILRVQLEKLPRVLARMRASKARLRRYLEGNTRVRLRRVPDAAGDTGGFLITSYPDRDAASAVCRGLRSLGIASASPEASNVLLAEYGFHIYSNIPGLREKIGTDARRTPWTLSENRLSRPNYELGACPVADDLFERSVILVIPSCLTAEDEDDILEAFGQVLDGLGALI